MIFSSLGFFLFFAVVYSAYWLLLEKPGHRVLFLFLASCFFYMTWNVKMIAIVLFLVVLDYFLGLAIARAQSPRARKSWLVLSLTSNLAMLSVFKYTNFFLQSAGFAARRLGFDVGFPIYDIILPLGISFHTFQSMSYTIDVYYKRIEPTRDFVRYATFVTFFPQLVAGPIVKARDLLPQLEKLPGFTWEGLIAGADLFLLGLVKKRFVADRLSMYVDPAFARIGTLDAVSTWCAVVAYAFQIYADFSGYTDMARGLAKTFGFDFMLNFRTPYLSRDISEFWTRWHISLSTWLKENLFMPLGGYRGSRLFGYRNLFLTMLLGGLWHGASWTFVGWGVYHGLLLIARRVYQRFSPAEERAHSLLRSTWDRLLIFFLVCLGWVFFRCQSFTDTGHAFANMFGLSGGGQRFVSAYFAPLVLLMLLHDASVYYVESHKIDFPAIALRQGAALRGLVYASAIFLLILFSPHDLRAFIYFQF